MKKFASILSVAVLLAACSTPGPQLTLSGLNPADFESEYEGAPTCLKVLTNDSGMEVCVTNFGGRIVSIMVPDSKGEFKDVVHGFDEVESYFPENNQTDFGASIGRYANRIGDGRFSLDGVEYQLPQNNYNHCLHGGPTGWQYKVYEVVEADDSHVVLKVSSPDGDNNFPGNVTARVTYTLTPDNRIEIAYEAETDKPTIINMTNHSYFNLSGDPTHTITDQTLQVNASSFTPVDDTFMTTGEILPVDGTPFDFREPRVIAEGIDSEDVQVQNGKGYDHNWVLDTQGDLSVPAVVCTSPVSGITLTVFTDEPGIQIYAGNFLDGTVTGKKGVVYGHRTAICFESQKFPDTPNKPQWPSARLDPGQKYTSHCVFAFSAR